jgi:sugar lactone lactonase YvrE
LIVTKKVPTNPGAVGRVFVIAGDGQPGLDDGPPFTASFSDPFGIAVDRQGNLYVADGGQSNRIRKIHPNGTVETVAGSSEGFADGNPTQAQFNTPSSLAIDRDGNLIVADTSNNRIRKIAPDGKVTTLAGSGRRGSKDGPAGEAEFDGPIGVAVDGRGQVFVADTYNDCIRKIASDREVITISGHDGPGFEDGDSQAARFNTPSGIAVDGAGNIFVADTGNSAIRKITPDGIVSTLVRNRHEEVEKSVSMRRPVGIAITHDGFLFVTHERGVLRISPAGNAEEYAGGALGFADGPGKQARFSGPAAIAIDREGNLFVADSRNYLIRGIEPVLAETNSVGQPAIFIQPEAGPREATGPPVPRLDATILGVGENFPWPVRPQNEPHEITGVMGEARGAPGAIPLDHLHSGLDIRAGEGDPVLSVLDEKVSSPIANWDHGGDGEGIQIGVISYAHVRVGRNSRNEIEQPERFKAIAANDGSISSVRVRRGTRFRVGDFIGTVNRLYHVHLNLGPWNGEVNPLVLPFVNLRDTTPPAIEPNGIEIVSTDGVPFKSELDGRLRISGDVRILVRAYDRVDLNSNKRKLGLFRIGYQVVNEDGTPAPGFERPTFNIAFDRLPPDDSSVLKVYAYGSGVSAYGTPTQFKYIVTNLVLGGVAREGMLRTSNLTPGNYLIRILAEDYAGNRALGPGSEISVSVVR